MSHVEMIQPHTPGIMSLDELSYHLRARSGWPPKFVWDFRSVDSCAIGLAARILHGKTLDLGSSMRVVHISARAWCWDHLPETRDMTEVEFNDIFIYAKHAWCAWLPPRLRGYLRTRPRDVANAIDNWRVSRVLAHQEALHAIENHK